MDFYRKILLKLDFVLLLTVAGILTMGLFVLNSATAHLTENYVMKQLVWVVIGVGVILVTLKFDYGILAKYYKHLYVLNLVLLVLVLIFGTTINGSKSWFVTPVGSFQPAEIGKIIIIICFAQFLVERQGRLNTFKEMIPAFLFVAVPVLLIMAQPDLGSMLVFIAIMVGMMFIANANWKILLGLFGGGSAAIIGYVIGIWKFGWWCPFEVYQLNRFLVLFDSSIDPKGVGWNALQAKIAIGNGGLLGQGLGAGSQSTGKFLPEQWTDFIFAVFCEELGFLGAAVLLILFGVLLYRGLRTARLAKDLFGGLIAIGVVSMYLFHIVENVGMNLGMMPITGIPLPFVSYGGSSMLANFIGLALLLNVYVRRQRLIF